MSLKFIKALDIPLKQFNFSQIFQGRNFLVVSLNTGAGQSPSSLSVEGKQRIYKLTLLLAHHLEKQK